MLLAPAFLLIAIAIKIDSRGPVLFRQTRVGRNEVPFEIFKFRTMSDCQPAGAFGVTVAGDTRITRVGRWLRDKKLDELPQLLNVVRGHMSLVGPRPELPKFVALYPPELRNIVLSVRPGITDYAAMQFIDESALLAEAEDPERYYIDHLMPRKIELYVRYVNEQSLLLDIRLIFATLARLWR